MNIDRLLQILTILSVVTFSAISVAVFLRTARDEGIEEAVKGMFSLRSMLGLLVVLAIAFLSAALVFIQPQEVGVVVSALSPRGYRTQPLPSGLRLIIPLVEEVRIYPIYWQTYTMSSMPLEGEEVGDDSITSRTSDGQEVALDCSVVFRIDRDQVIQVHIDWQDRYIQDLVRPLLRGMVRTAVSQFTVDEVNSSKRLDLERILDRSIHEVLEDKGFVLDRFLLRNIAFSPEYATSVEMKQVAEQGRISKGYEADQIRNLSQGEADRVRIRAGGDADARVIRAKAEAEARVIEAEGQAKALQLVSGVLAENPSLLTYEYIQKLPASIRTMLLPADTPLILPLPTMEPEEEVPPTPTPIGTTFAPIPAQTSTPTVAIETPTPVPTPTPTPTPDTVQ